MAVGLITKKYLEDIAEAIRVKLGNQNTYTPPQMASAISNITGLISGTITKSSDANVGLITDAYLSDIADAIRAKLNVATEFTPDLMADAILSIAQPQDPTCIILPIGPTLAYNSYGTDKYVYIESSNGECRGTILCCPLQPPNYSITVTLISKYSFRGSADYNKASDIRDASLYNGYYYLSTGMSTNTRNHYIPVVDFTNASDIQSYKGLKNAIRYTFGSDAIPPA